MVTPADAQALAASVWNDQQNLHGDIRIWMRKKHKIELPTLGNDLILATWEPLGIPYEPTSPLGRDIAFAQAWMRFVAEFKKYKADIDAAWTITYGQYEKVEKYRIETKAWRTKAKAQGVYITPAPETPSETDVEKAAGKGVPWTGILVVGGIAAAAYGLSQVRQIGQIFG